MKTFLRTLLLILVLIGVLAALVWYGDARKVAAQVGRFRHAYLAWFVLVMLAHEFVRGITWLYLLRALGIRASVRSQVFAFSVGEAAKFVPTGAYAQNVVLQRSARTEIGRSSVATTAIIVGEIAAAVLGVEAFGVGNWSLGLRIAIVCLLVIAAVQARARFLKPAKSRRFSWLRHRKFAESLAAEFQRFRAGTAALARPRILAVTMLLSVLYVLIAGTGLWVVVLALGITGVSFWQAVGVSCFGLAFYVVLGSLEAADVGAFAGIGVTKSAAVSAVLVNRALSVGITLTLAAFVMAILRDEVYLLRGRRTEVHVGGPASEPAT